MDRITSGTLAVISAALRADPIVTPDHARAVMALASGEAESVGAETDKVLTRSVVAELLGVSPRCVTEYARRGIIRPIRLGAAGARAVGYSAASVRAALAKR